MVTQPTSIDSSSLDDSSSFQVGPFSLSSRLILGTGKYESFEVMQQSHQAAETDCVTIAVRREKLHDSDGRNILDFIDTNRYILLPNTAGCYDAETAVRCARMGREILRDLDNPGAEWVKLEVLGDSRTLLPDPLETLRACEKLVEEEFSVLCYTNDDPIMAMRLKKIGATSVMPAGSPIGSGLGVINHNNLSIILEMLKSEDRSFPVIVDAGVGTASDAAIAMELGADGVLLNTAVAGSANPVQMARAMMHGIKAGRLAFLAGRIPKSKYAAASSPEVGVIASRVKD